MNFQDFGFRKTAIGTGGPGNSRNIQQAIQQHIQKGSGFLFRVQLFKLMKIIFPNILNFVASKLHRKWIQQKFLQS